jgi:copper homeostasis protein
MTRSAHSDPGVLLEIAVQDAAGARSAVAAGADRVELCQALSETGGLTPSSGTVESVLAAVGSGERLTVLVRPRPGGYVYDADEIALVSADIRDIVRRGAGSVIVGALTPDGAVDAEAMRRWRDAAGDADVAVHRAIDTLADPASVVDELAALGVRRILTSGGAARSIDGIGVIAAMVRASAGRLQIMPGGGVRVQDIARLVASGVDAVHLSARRSSGDTAPSGPGGGSEGYDVTDPSIVSDARAALDHALL